MDAFGSDERTGGNSMNGVNGVGKINGFGGGIGDGSHAGGAALAGTTNGERGQERWHGSASLSTRGIGQGYSEIKVEDGGTRSEGDDSVMNSKRIRSSIE